MTLFSTLALPIPFENLRVNIEDRSQFNNPVTTMLNSSNGLFNLKDFMTSEEFDEKWRWRIDEIQIYPLDKEDQIIQSHGFDFEERIRFAVTFPTVFNDTDMNQNTYSFLAQHFSCLSSYATEGTYLEKSKTTH